MRKRIALGSSHSVGDSVAELVESAESPQGVSVRLAGRGSVVEAGSAELPLGTRPPGAPACILTPMTDGSARFGTRLSGVVRRRPYVTATVTSVLLLEVWRGGFVVATGPREHPWLNWVALGFFAYNVAFFALARRLTARRRRPGVVESTGEELLPLLRLAVAAAPTLLGVVAWELGASSWVAGVGFGVSMVLLFVNARMTAAASGA